jgi:hypothetical protein
LACSRNGAQAPGISRSEAAVVDQAQALALGVLKIEGPTAVALNRFGMGDLEIREA